MIGSSQVDDKPQNSSAEYREIFGVPICSEDLAAAVERVANAVRVREKLDIGVVNAAKLVNMRRDEQLQQAVMNSDVIYADGMSVVFASRFLGRPLPGRVAGIDLMHGILQRGSVEGYRVFCLGATEEVLASVCEEFGKDYSGVTIAGSHHGYFGVDEEADIAKLIKESNADVLFVAITSPKKENFMSQWSELMDVPVVHGVGGSFDVVAGVAQRAPESWQRLGLEWLYRVKQEPRRLWKRYLVTNTIFLWMLLTEKLRQIVLR
jgi:N-acetylglucosaminyldiphosphoundecaprenol N-acetyl-beta-D-mannosaminyltransferase